MDQKHFSAPINLRNITVTDAFWKNEMELVRKEVIPYQWEALNDNVPGAAPSFCMKNYRLAGKLNARKKADPNYVQPVWTTGIFNLVPENMDQLEERFYGFLFQDTDFSKWVEAVAYSLTQHPDEDLEKLADEAIDIVCAAQLDNGYLDTFYIINDQSKIFTNLRDNHELYCFGHLTEGAVAYYEATGKDKLLRAACRFADYIDNYFGPEEGKCKGYPGHEIAEMALVRLYHATSEERYLNLSRFFIDMRGTQPYYFDTEIDHPYTAPNDGTPQPLRNFYHQAHLPVREQDEAHGHAVRAVYLYSGMADIAKLTQDDALKTACERLWDNIVNKKMYITGGIGATHMGEAFSFNYDLPNDTAYAETCASIGLVFFARRMLEMQAQSKYANVLERALYNGVLSGMALDGKSFFYVNPLEVLPEACHKDERKFHVKPIRQKWFGCACCPPNIARLLSSISSYAFTESDDTLYTHLYMGSEIKKTVGDNELFITVDSTMPYSNHASVKVKTTASTPFRLALRLPDWADTAILTGPHGSYAITIDHYTAVAKNNGVGESGDNDVIKDQSASANSSNDFSTEIAEAILQSHTSYIRDGYLYLSGDWIGETVIQISFLSNPRLMISNPAVRENIGKVAVLCGPMVYCLEEADNGKDLHLLEINCDNPGFILNHDSLFGAMTITANGFRHEKFAETAALYNTYQPSKKEACKLTFVPYYLWNNRGEGEMTVWVKGN